jgi:hypothetical protein
LRGLTGAEDEFLLAATVQNLKKLVRLCANGPPMTAKCAVCPCPLPPKAPVNKPAGLREQAPCRPTIQRRKTYKILEFFNGIVVECPKNVKKRLAKSARNHPRDLT